MDVVDTPAIKPAGVCRADLDFVAGAAGAADRAVVGRESACLHHDDSENCGTQARGYAH